MILDPRGEELAREPAHAHSRDMSGSAELAIRDEPQDARHVEAGVKRPVAAGIIPDNADIPVRIMYNDIRDQGGIVFFVQRLRR